MKVRSATKAGINDFLGQKRLAIVGVSRDEKDYSRLVFSELKKRGYDVVPVNPNADTVDGARCYKSVAEVSPAVDGVMVLLPADAAAQALEECERAGVRRVWLRNDAPERKEARNHKDMTLIRGYCPFMFLPNTQFFHKCHAFGLKIVGKYPKEA